jgi:hypothetical protein
MHYNKHAVQRFNPEVNSYRVDNFTKIIKKKKKKNNLICVQAAHGLQ